MLSGEFDLYDDSICIDISRSAALADPTELSSTLSNVERDGDPEDEHENTESSDSESEYAPSVNSGGNSCP